MEKESAVLGVDGEAPQGVNANHVGICRFGSTRDDTYLKFLSRFNAMIPKRRIDQANTEGASPVDLNDRRL